MSWSFRGPLPSWEDRAESKLSVKASVVTDRALELLE